MTENNISNKVVFIIFAISFLNVIACTDNNANNIRVIYGTVMDQAHSPLPNSTVAVEGTGISTIADMNGKYNLRVSADNNVNIRASHPGYYENYVDVDISSDYLNTNYDIVLISEGAAPFSKVLRKANNSERRYSGPALIELKDGSILLSYDYFYEGNSDDYSMSKIVGMTSTDGGFSWSDQFDIHEGEYPLLQSSLIYNGQVITSFFLERHTYDDLRVIMRESYDNGFSWGPFIEITKPQSGYYQINNDRAVRLNSGRIILPIAYCKIILPRDEADRIEAFAIYSDDDFVNTKESENRIRILDADADEPGIIELLDNRVLMYLRTKNGYIYKSVSNDEGEVWSEPEPIYDLPSADAPATMKRIPETGDILAIWNNSQGVQGAYGRSVLSSAVSKDDGAVFENIKIIENNSDYSFGYPTVLFKGLYALVVYWSRDDSTIDESGSGLMDLKISIVPNKWFLQ